MKILCHSHQPLFFFSPLAALATPFLSYFIVVWVFCTFGGYCVPFFFAVGIVYHFSEMTGIVYLFSFVKGFIFLAPAVSRVAAYYVYMGLTKKLTVEWYPIPQSQLSQRHPHAHGAAAALHLSPARPLAQPPLAHPPTR